MLTKVIIDQEKIISIAKKRGISYLALFGSVARGDSTDQSDVDLAVRFDRPVSLFEYIDVQLEMEALLGYPVDLVPIDDLYSFVRESISADLTVLYESPQKTALSEEVH